MADERDNMVQISVRFSREELQRIDRCAHEKRRSRHAHLRMCALADGGGEIDAANSPDVVTELQKIAGGLTAMHRSKMIDAPAFERWYELLLQLRDAAMRKAGWRR